MSQPAQRFRQQPDGRQNLLESPRALFRAEFLRIMAVQVLFGISFSSFLILPKFLKQVLGSTAEEIGWMAAAALGSGAIASPFIGEAINHFDRKRIMFAALVLEFAAALGFLLVDQVDLFALALRCAQGLAFVAIFTCNASLVGDLVDNQLLGRALGYLGASMLITNALAPLIAEPLAETMGWSAVFNLAALSSALTLLIIVRQPSRRIEKPNTPLGTQASLARSTAPLFYGSLLMGAGIGVMFTYVQPYALQQGAADVGGLFLGYAVAATSVRVFFGGLTDRLGPAIVAIWSLGLYSLTVLLAASLTPSTLIYIGALLGVAHGFFYPALTAAGLKVLPRSGRARFLGWFAFCFNAGFAVAVLLLGPVADRWGYRPIFLLTAACLSSGVVPLIHFARHQWPVELTAVEVSRRAARIENE